MVGADLGVGIYRPPLFLFASAEAARIRGKMIGARGPSPLPGLSRTVLSAGFANFLGFWPPLGDDFATAFCADFYRDLVNGLSLGYAVQSGRRSIQKLDSSEWSHYALYGNPEFIVKVR